MMTEFPNFDTCSVLPYSCSVADLRWRGIVPATSYGAKEHGGVDLYLWIDVVKVR
jgi:hypothetical protein